MYRLALAACALGAWTLAWGDAPAPERLLRLNLVEGDVAVQSDGQRAAAARPDRPLLQGDRVVTPDDARAELLLDASPIRLDGGSDLRVEALELTNVVLGLDHGVASLQIRELYEGDHFEIELANSRISIRQPGEYRVEARAADLSVLAVVVGAADVT